MSSLPAQSLPSPTNTPIRRALISVTDKTGLPELAAALAARNIEIISTGGTAALLASRGIKVRSIESLTGFPEIMHGRVKTLHPKVHGGLLALRDHPEHKEAMQRHEIEPIDLVIVNLYAFEATIAKPNTSRADAIENIDIGGPSMIRSAAKNHHYVTIVTDPADYPAIIAELTQNQGATTYALRANLAAKAFALTAQYDAAIASYMLANPPAQDNAPAAPLFPQLLALRATKSASLRYGENPHQQAALYATPQSTNAPTLARATQLHGKELSYNNINDAVAALELVIALKRFAPHASGAACIKHTNPCGVALATSDPTSTSLAAIDEAIAGDPIAAFGGIIATNAPIDLPAAQRLCAKDVFLEVLIAPSFEPAALEALKARWTNLRLLAVGDMSNITPSANLLDSCEFRSIPGGILMQERNTRLSTPAERSLAAGPVPSPAHEHTLTFLEIVGKFLFSNAIVIGGPSPQRGDSVIRMFGAGAGQMDRVTSCRLAVAKAGDLTRNAAAYSDAFFPFADGPTLLADAGIKAIMHPGGSKRDQDTFELCNARGISCLLSTLRHFRH